jgi:hypothetical protein
MLYGTGAQCTTLCGLDEDPKGLNKEIATAWSHIKNMCSSHKVVVYKDIYEC